MTQTTERPRSMVLSDHSAIAPRDNNMAVALATYNDKAQLAVIRDQICVGATASEMWVFLARCVALGLDPFSRQIYFVKRDSANGPVVAHQIGIDGFRSIAERTGELVGITEPEYEGETEVKGIKAPAIARVTVTREIRGKDREFTGSARWSEFYPGDKLGFMWQKMPFHMLGKCAEAQAMRRAFPQQMGGLNTDAETMSYEGMMAVADASRFSNPHEPQYIEVTDKATGEMKQVRAGDEYERIARLQYPDEPASEPAPIRQQGPEDRAAYAQGNTTAQRAAASLSEVLDDPEAPPEPPDDVERTEALAGDAEPIDNESEPAQWDYGMCREIFDAHPELTLDRPLPRLKPEAYAAWHEKYVKTLEAAGGLPF